MPEPLDAGDDLIEVLAILRAQERMHLGRGRDNRAVLRILRVEDSHRIAPETVLRLVGEGVAVLGEVRRERLLDLGLALRVADGVELEAVVLQADFREETDGEVDDLDVGCGLLWPVALEAPLPELPVAKELRPLSSGHRLLVRGTGAAPRPVPDPVQENPGGRRRG